MPDYVDTMAYAGETPWHGLGTRLPEDMPTLDMIGAAGLGWMVEKRPVFYQRGEQFEAVPDRFTVCRSDTGASLGATVSGRYEPFQNAELFAFGDALREAGDVRWHTAGSVKDGRRVWVLAQSAGQFEVKRRGGVSDRHAPFLLLTAGHDGAFGIRVQFTSVRVVCWNTLSAAVGEKDRAHFTARHTRNVRYRVADAREALELAASHFVAEVETLQGLADTPMDRAGFVEFACQILTGKDDPQEAGEVVQASEGRSRSMYERKGSELVQLFEHGKGNAGDSLFDGLNAVTEFIDHQRGRVKVARTIEARAKGLDSAWYGAGAETKRRGLKLLMARAGVK